MRSPTGWSSRRAWGLLLALSLLVVLGGLAAWWLPDPNPPARLVIPLPVKSWGLGFAADGRSYQTGTEQDLFAWDPTTGRPIQPHPAEWIWYKTFAQDRQTFVGGVADNAGNQWLVWADTATEAIRKRLLISPQRTRHIALIDDDQTVWAFVTDASRQASEVVTWDLASGTETRRVIQGPRPGVLPEAFAPGGLTWAYLDKVHDAIQIWDGRTNRPLGPLLRTPTTRRDLVTWHAAASLFTPDGQTLFVCGGDGQLEVWDLRTFQLIRTDRIFPIGTAISNNMALSPDGRTIAMTGIALWPRTRLGAVWESIQTSITGHDFRTRTQEVVLIDRASGAGLARYPGAKFGGFSPDGGEIVTQENQGTLSFRAAPELDLPGPPTPDQR